MTLIYGDNGRGKSTLALVLDSLSTGRTEPITDRKTLGEAKEQRVIVQFEDGLKSTFSPTDGWSTTRPEILVFDSAFVDANVFSGSTINTEHQKGLLEFALGETALAAKRDADKAAIDSVAATKEVSAAKSALAGYHSGIDLQAFRDLPHVEGLDDELKQALETQELARRTVALTQRPRPAAIGTPDFDLASVDETLARSLAVVHEAAAATVQEHLSKIGVNSAEAWLRDGLVYTDGPDCPYCGQDISANDLIAAYRQHFDAAYQVLQASVASLPDAAYRIAGAATAAAVISNIREQIVIEASWTEEIDLESTVLDEAALDGLFGQLHSELSTIIENKLDKPTERIEPGELDAARAVVAEIEVEISTIAASLRRWSEAVSAFVDGLAATDVAEIDRRIEVLEHTKQRHSVEVMALVDGLKLNEGAKKEADTAKDLARSILNASMQTTLQAYESKVNEWLEKFDTSFVIEQMKHDFRAGSAQAKYHLKLRGIPVPLSGGPPSFSTTLSDSDKRTLAFAFFLARTFDDDDLSSTIVVIDDPMTSLDANRQRATTDSLRRLAGEADQLILLAHDLHFLHGIEQACIGGDPPPMVKTFEVGRIQGDFSELKSVDLERCCESPYFSNHRTVTAFAESGEGDPRAVATSIRPMIEGYLHRRFPDQVPKGVMLGKAITAVSDAEAGSVLEMAASQVGELRALNGYAGQFHHDTNPDVLNVQINSTELSGYCKRALAVVHGWS